MTPDPTNKPPSGTRPADSLTLISGGLAHEQIHFDIAELYARKLHRRIVEEHTNFREFEPRAKNLLREVSEALNRRQDEYDTEVYTDRHQQAKWSEWVATELAISKDFSGKRTVLDYR